MRSNRLIETERCYHLISRLAHRAFFLDEEERDRAVNLLRRVEEFSGVIVLAYAIMSNHFHIFIYVPEAEEIGEEEILRRIKVLYREASLGQILSEWKRLKDEEARELSYGIPTGGYVSRFTAYKVAFVRRMWNSSEFMRTFKQHFTMSFNGRRDHHGTMFESRYHERNHKPEETVMWKTSAYIDANPVNAGICAWPDQYKWCGFAAACSGDGKARRGYEFMYGMGGDWQAIREAHEVSIRRALDERAIEKVREQREQRKRMETKGRSPVPALKADSGLEMPAKYRVKLTRGDSRIAERILELLRDGPLSPGELHEAVGIRSRVHLIKYYLQPLLEEGLIVRTDPDHPRSPRQKYKLS